MEIRCKRVSKLKNILFPYKSAGRMIFRFLVLFICITATAFPQQGNIWYFGNQAGLDFNSGLPASLPNSSSTTSEGCSSIADANGNLLFYTNGTTVYNKNHLVMTGGTGLFGQSISAQSAVIVPLPGSTTIYYIFTMRDWQTAGNGANYSIVDMSLSSGLGAVTSANIFLNANARESLTATKHCNGIDYWITFQDRSTQSYNSYLLTNAGLSPSPIVSNASTFSIATGGNRYGYLKFSPNGKKLAYSLGGAIPNGTANETTVEVCDFDNATGIVSNPQILVKSSTIPNVYCCEFSPDNNMLYVVAFNGTFINQFNLQAGTTSQIVASMTNIGGTSNTIKCCLQIAPDNKIYVSLNNQNSVGVISNPNIPGTGCNYINAAVSLGAGQTCSLGFPNFIQSTFYTPVNLGNDTTACSNQITLNAGNGWTGYLWSTGQTTQTITVTSSGAYWVQVDNGLSCSPIIDTIHVTLSSSFLVNITAITNPTCFGNTNGSATAVVTGGTAPYTYQWSQSAGGQTTALASNLPAGEDTITVTDANGCTNSQSVTIIQPLNLTLSITGTNNTNCNFPNGTATATVTGGTPGYTYLWDNTQNLQTAINLPGGIYNVIVTDINGCTAFTSVTITSTSVPPVPIITGNTALCGSTGTILSGATSLAGSGVISSYQWLLNGAIINGATSGNYTAFTPGNYSLQLTNSNGCSATSAQTVVSLSGSLSLLISNIVNPSCFGNTNGSATVVATGGESPYSYLWSQSAGGQTTASVSNLSAGVDSVTVTDANGCSGSQSVTITQPPPLTLSTVSTNNTDCSFPNGTATVTATGGTPGYNYFWNNSQHQQTATHLAGGIYNIVVEDKNGCSALSTVSVTIIPLNPAHININLSSTTIDLGDYAQLSVTENEAGTYLWSPATELTCINCPNPIASPTETTTYCVEFTDINGCVSTDCANLNVQGGIYVPNGFTPNDDHVNDLFIPILPDTHDYTLMIFNRWGEKLIETSSPGEGWNGYYKGKLCEQDTYVFKIKFSYDSDNSKHELSGKVTLIQ